MVVDGWIFLRFLIEGIICFFLIFDELVDEILIVDLNGMCFCFCILIGIIKLLFLLECLVLKLRFLVLIGVGGMKGFIFVIIFNIFILIFF